MELAVLFAFLDGLRDRILLITGEGGIGKSTMLRAASRLAGQQGRTVISIDARSLGADVAALDAALAPAATVDRPLVLIDSGEHLGGLGAHLRVHVLPSLSDQAQVIIAGRGEPDPGWSRDGWEAVRRTLELPRLDDADAAKLAQSLGVEDPSAEAALLVWAQGLPLAVVAGADIARSLEQDPFDRGDFDRRLGQALVRHVVDGEVGAADRAALAVCAIAPMVDQRLLEAVAPYVPGAETMAWLGSLSFVEGSGGRVRLHDRLRVAIRAELDERDEARARDLRRRVTDHLYQRAIDGEPHLVNELRVLISDATVRWGLGEDVGPLLRADRARPGDAAELADALGIADDPGWPRVRRWFDEAPDNVLVLRDGTERLVGAGLWATPAHVPSFATEDPLLGPILIDAAERVPDGNALILGDVFDLLGTPDDVVSPVVSVGNAAVVARSGLPNPRWMYASARADDARTGGFLAAMGYVRQPHLDLVEPSRTLELHVLDNGPGGLIAVTRNLIYRDLGLAPPSSLTIDVVRDALRNAHDPVALAASPLATGVGVSARAASVRALLDDAVATAFGDSEAERLTRATIERGYLAPEVGHTRAQGELHLSRTAYFARLARAVDRVATVVLERRPRP